MKTLRTFFADLFDGRAASQPTPIPGAQGLDFMLQAGFTPVGQFLEPDIFIAGYPKSGNTWFQNLIAGIYFGVDPEFAPDTLVQELVPDIHFKTYYQRFKTPMFFKTHNLPKSEYKRVVYLVRDGRDVMVSYYHHQIAMLGENIDFMMMVRDGKDLFPSKWHEHVQAWDANLYHAEKIVIKYEDLKQDPLSVLNQFCDFAQIKRDPTFIKQVIDKTEFSKLQSKEKSGQMFFANQAWPGNHRFFRRGMIGSHKDEMPSEVLDVFLKEAEPTLKSLGYV